MKEITNDRLSAALAYVPDREKLFAVERERNRAHNLKFSASIKASVERRRLMPKNLIKSRAHGRIGWLFRHETFRTGQYPRACAKSGSRQHVISLHDLLGATAAEVKAWIEGQFSSGMSWLNYGSRWHIGHRVPARLFDCSDPQQLRACFYYKNLQPELPEENTRRMNEDSA